MNLKFKLTHITALGTDDNAKVQLTFTGMGATSGNLTLILEQSAARQFTTLSSHEFPLMPSDPVKKASPSE